MNTQLTIPEAAPFEKPPQVPTPMHLIELAVEKGADADQLAKLMELQLKWEANEARKAFIAAMQLFRANQPEINKTKHVSFANKDGKQTDYDHAELHVITELITNALKAVGIIHSWKTSDAGGKVTVTCVLTHEMGHSEEAATLSGPSDTSGGKNNIQAIGSTVTYLQRYTLLSATGLAAKGMDDDGKSEGLPENAIMDYVIQMQDASSFPDLQTYFRECYTKSKTANDPEAQGRFVKVYEQRKRELRESRQ